MKKVALICLIISQYFIIEAAYLESLIFDKCNEIISKCENIGTKCETINKKIDGCHSDLITKITTLSQELENLKAEQQSNNQKPLEAPNQTDANHSEASPGLLLTILHELQRLNSEIGNIKKNITNIQSTLAQNSKSDL